MSDSNESWQKIIKSILNFKERVSKRKLFNELFRSRQLFLLFVESKCKRGNHSFSAQLTKLFSFKRNPSCFLSMVLVKASAKFGWINLLKYVCTLKLPLGKNPLLKKLPLQILWSSPIWPLPKFQSLLLEFWWKLKLPLVPPLWTLLSHELMPQDNRSCKTLIS